MPRQPSNLPLPNRVHDFDALNRSPRRVKRPEALHGSDPAFHCPVILLHYIVEIANESGVAAPAKFPSALEFIDRPRIGGIPVYLITRGRGWFGDRNAF